MGTAQQVILAQKFVTMTGNANDNLCDAIMQSVVNTQREIENAGMQGCTAVVRQVLTIGTLQIKVTVIIDIMQIVTIHASEEVQKPVIIE